MKELDYSQQNARRTLDAVMRTLPAARRMGFCDDFVTEVAKYAGGSTDNVFALYRQRTRQNSQRTER